MSPVGNYKFTLSELKSNTTELHPKVRQTCFFYFYSIWCLTLSNKHHAQLMLMLCWNGNNVESVSTECDWWPGDGQTQPSFPEPDHRHSVPWQATPAQRHCKSGLNITLHSARKRITMSYTWIMWFLLENVLWFCPPLRTSPYYVFIRIRGLQFWHS